MAFPQVDATATSGEFAADVTSHTVTLPTGIVSGDLLIVSFASDANPTVTWPGGWTEIFNVDSSGRALLAVAYRQADGTEGSTITVTTSVTEKSAHCSYRISGHGDPATQPPQVSNGSVGFSTSPNSALLIPTGGAKDYLWLTICGAQKDKQATAFPTNYINGLESTGGGASGALCASAERDLNAGSEDPGSFTINTPNARWVAITIVVHPTTAAPPVSQTLVIPAEALAIVSQIKLSSLESLVPATQNKITTYESLRSASQSKVNPLESLEAISRTKAQPVEALARSRQTKSVALESLIPIASSTSHPLEALAGLVRTTSIPMESTANVVVQTVILPIESLLALASLNTLQIEALRTSAQTKAVPVEALARLVQTKVLPVESLTLSQATTIVPIESSANVILQLVVVPLESLGSPSTTIDISLESLIALVQAGQLPIESLRTLTQPKGLTVEALVGLIVTGIIPLEATGLLAPVSRLAVLPIETTAAILNQTVILYEVLSTALRAGAVLSSSVAYHTASTNPGATNDSTENFRIASLWINTTDNGVFICIDPLPGFAVWIKLGPEV